MVVIGFLGAAGALTGALVGFVSGIVWAVTGLPPLGAIGLTVLVAAALGADVAHARGHGPRPFSTGRQVPQYWGRLFGGRTTALLYGARLGVGPSTILATWTWWAAAVAGASVGPWPAAGVGVVFAVSRTATMVLAMAGAGPAMSRRVAVLRDARVAVAWVTNVGLVVVVTAMLASCSGSDSAGGNGGGGGAADTSTSDEPPELTLDASTTSTTTEADVALDALILDETLPGFTRADDVIGAGPLDLEAAAQAEADPAAEQALLETRKFQRGVSRAWIDPLQDVAYEAVYTFADEAGARAYLADGAETLVARAAIPFDVPGVPGAQGFTTLEEDEQGAFTAHAASFTRGRNWFLVLVGSDSSRRTADEARSLARAADERQATGSG